MMHSPHRDEHRACDHDDAHGHADEILQFAHAVGKALTRRATHRANREESREHRKRIGRLFEEIADDGDRVGAERGTAHQKQINNADDKRESEAAFARACARARR